MPAYADTGELHKVMRLLQEYTETLRDLSDRRARANFRCFWAALIVTLVLTTTAAVLYWAPHERFAVWLALSVAALLVVAFIPVGRSWYAEFIYFHDSAQVASSLLRLAKTTSQYSDHAASRLGDKFEFDLRVADAEATLRMYSRVFLRGERDLERLARKTPAWQAKPFIEEVHEVLESSSSEESAKAGPRRHGR